MSIVNLRPRVPVITHLRADTVRRLLQATDRRSRPIDPRRWGQDACLFWFLVCGRGRWWSRSELIELVWPDPDLEPESANTNHLSIVVYKLRRRIAPYGWWIESWPCFGYRLVRLP